jgi:DNA-binding protein HU-beta
MNKTEMAEKLAGQTDISRAKAVEIVEAIFSTDSGKGIIAVELDADREVSIAGFGKFETRKRGAREGRNPATGETIKIGAKKVAAFKARRYLTHPVTDADKQKDRPAGRSFCLYQQPSSST